MTGLRWKGNSGGKSYPGVSTTTFFVKNIKFNYCIKFCSTWKTYDISLAWWLFKMSLTEIYYHNDLKEVKSFSHNVTTDQINCWLYHNKTNTEIDQLKQLSAFQSLHSKRKLKEWDCLKFSFCECPTEDYNNFD